MKQHAPRLRPVVDCAAWLTISSTAAQCDSRTNSNIEAMFVFGTLQALANCRYACGARPPRQSHQLMCQGLLVCPWRWHLVGELRNIVGKLISPLNEQKIPHGFPSVHDVHSGSLELSGTGSI